MSFLENVIGIPAIQMDSGGLLVQLAAIAHKKIL
jgi:hypothetical protein